MRGDRRHHVDAFKRPYNWPRKCHLRFHFVDGEEKFMKIEDLSSQQHY